MGGRQLVLFAIAVTTIVAWLVVAVSAAVVVAPDVFLLCFTGLMFAVFLTKTSNLVADKSGLGYGASLGTVVLLLLLCTCGVFFWFGQRIESRVQQASTQIDEATQQLRTWVTQHPVAQSTIRDLPYAGELIDMTAPDSSQSSSEDGSQSESKGSAASESGSQDSQSSGGAPNVSSVGKAAGVIARVFQTTLGAIMNIAIVVFVGLYLATDPALYRDGLVKLFPQARRDHVRDVMNKMGSTLWSWLLGRFASMAITGVGTAIGLALIGVPLAAMLGTLTGLLTFIPNIGPALGLAISALVAVPKGGTTVMLVIVVFVVFQLLESYVITPLIDQHQVSIPPAVLIGWQVLLGILFGFLGVAVSTPLLTVLFVLVRKAYIEDVLGDHSLPEM